MLTQKRTSDLFSLVNVEQYSPLLFFFYWRASTHANAFSCYARCILEFAFYYKESACMKLDQILKKYIKRGGLVWL